MIKISSQSTYFNKRILPILSLAFFVAFTAPFIFQTLTGDIPRDKAVFVFIFIFFGGVAGLFLYLYLFHPLLDEVYYDNKSLLVKNGKTELVIPFDEVQDIAYSANSRPPRVIITLYEFNQFGIELYFLPPTSLFPLEKTPEVEDLLITFKNYKSSL